jgi:butyryl-CoA dehydrogenase
MGHAARYARERRQFGRAIAEFGLIKHKLSEMAVRCYVGDAMVYRALGDVDQALEGVDPGNLAQVLKTIEAFAVECSINKVWTSEALGWVTDEAIQVFGGNGYSREFPAERAYRDARITRIYEGTNEINRLLIPTRLLKQAPGVFAREHVRDPLAEMEPLARSNGILATEHDLLTRGKRLAVAMLAQAGASYGGGLKEEQEALGHIADVIMELYAIESALARTEKLVASRGEADCGVAIDIARVYASDAADRLAHSARQVLATLAEREHRSVPPEAVSRWLGHPGFDAIAARRRIADAVIQVGKHPY